MSWPSQMMPAARRPRVASLPAAALLLTPAVLLALSSVRAEGLTRSLAVGVAVTLGLEALFLLVRYGSQRATRSLFLIAFYAVAALVLRFNSPDFNSPFTHCLLAASLLLPVALFVRREIAATIGEARRAKFVIRQFLARRDWPESFAEYREDPMVRALRHGLEDDAAPVLPLLAHEDVRIQVAALTALEAFPTWHVGQVEVILQRAQFTDQPAVRAAAVLALADVRKDRHLQALLNFLRDPYEEVRLAAATAVLWDAGRRWPVVRTQIRWALAAQHAERDGPLPCSGSLPPDAVNDLVTWSAEAGAIGKRATQTLIRHCKKLIVEDGSSAAVSRVAALVENSKVPPALRVELAHRLQKADVFPPGVAGRLLGPAQPTMLRLLAAGAVLSHRQDPRAVEVLREAGRQPNREIALAAAQVIQKYLSVDMGLPVGGEKPAPNSREAVEVARNVHRWATEAPSHSTAETPADAELPVSDAASF
jgi:HEAT repeats